MMARSGTDEDEVAESEEREAAEAEEQEDEERTVKGSMRDN